MRHNYYLHSDEPEHRLRLDHTHEVKHRNQWNATVTTRHYSEADALVEKRWRTAHGFRVELEVIAPNSHQ